MRAERDEHSVGHPGEHRGASSRELLLRLRREQRRDEQGGQNQSANHEPSFECGALNPRAR
jgi:hypothetical protein